MSPAPVPSFASALAVALRLRGLSQQQLAVALDVEASTVSRLLSGDRAPSASLLARIADIVGWDAAERGHALDMVAAIQSPDTTS